MRIANYADTSATRIARLPLDLSLRVSHGFANHPRQVKFNHGGAEITEKLSCKN